MTPFDRRSFLRGLGALGAGLGLGTSLAGRAALPARAQGAKDPTFLVTLTAYGGASIVDSFMAVRRSESRSAASLGVYEDEEVVEIADSPLRAIRASGTIPGLQGASWTSEQLSFVRKHHAEMAILTQTVSSVNHDTAQWRAVTGANAWRGRTLQEAVAIEHGQDAPIPNVYLTTGSGFVRRGHDPSVPARFRGELVPDPSVWPLALSATRGIRGAPDAELVREAIRLRDRTLEPGSEFTRVFERAPRLKRWLELRDQARQIDQADLVSRLTVRRDSPQFPLSDYGLSTSPSADELRAVFPDLDRDIVEAQAALAFLLLKERVSVSVTLGPNSSSIFFNEDGGLVVRQTPIGFDYSHSDHRGGQMLMWNRVMSLADRLIDLLKSEPLDSTRSLWDRTVLYIATDFGRIRWRPDNATVYSSGHELNNGVVLISPMVRGDTIWGGVDPDTLMTYGVEPGTGRPTPGASLTEAHTYAGILHVLGVDISEAGLPDMSFLRGA